MTEEKELTLKQCRAAFSDVRTDLARLENLVIALERRLFGELGAGGDVAVLKSEVASLYHELGMLQAQLRRFRDALKP